jgi:hypothetical protein
MNGPPFVGKSPGCSTKHYTETAFKERTGHPNYAAPRRNLFSDKKIWTRYWQEFDAALG